MTSRPASVPAKAPDNVAQPVKQALVKDLRPRDGRDLRAGDDMSLSLNFERYKTTYTEYGR